MVFLEDDLHGDIFSLVLFIQWIFFGPYELVNISQMLFITHCQSYYRILCILCLEISESDSTYVYSRDFLVDSRSFGCIGHILSSHWAFMIYTHACTISDYMDSLTFEHSVDRAKSLRISTW